MLVLLIYSILVCSISPAYADLVYTTVITPRGTLIGQHLDFGNDTTSYYGQADFFGGIPYAVPPVGNLRYKMPRPLIAFPQNPYNATGYRYECIQGGGNVNTSSEDCLFINIITPNATANTKLPVYVWIHGGGLVGGNSHNGAAEIVRAFNNKGIVFASIEYRMGWLGLFTTWTQDFPPNLGLLDQVLALKYVQEEIPYFGGDPTRVTIGGQSAGAASVSAHTYSPLTANLFAQGIIESGPVFLCYEDADGPTYQNRIFALHACNFTDDMWNSGNFAPLKQCLMNISIEDGLRNAGNVHLNNDQAPAGCWNIVQDNYFFPGNPTSLGKTRPNKPLIIGACKDDNAFRNLGQFRNNASYYTRQNVEGNLNIQFVNWWTNSTANLTSQIIKVFTDNYFPNGVVPADDDYLAWYHFAVDVGTGAFFTYGSLRDVEYYIQNNNPNVYAYEFDWSHAFDVDINGVNVSQIIPSHGCEMGYVFGWNNGWNDDDKAVATSIQEYWVNFIKTGKPSTDNSWKPAASKDFTAIEYMAFYNVSMTKTGYRVIDEKVYNQILPSIFGEFPRYLEDKSPLCTTGYQSKTKNTTCYEAFGNQLKWTDAQSACISNSYGSLVSVGSAFANADLLNYAKSAFSTCQSFYIGLWRPDNSTWLWTNYDNVGYKNWKAGYPNSDPNANCVVLNVGDGTWTNQACDTTSCYLCGTYF